MDTRTKHENEPLQSYLEFFLACQMLLQFKLSLQWVVVLSTLCFVPR